MIEVVIAVGVIAVAVATMLALMPLLTRQMRDASDSLVAQRLAGGVEAELRRLASGGNMSGLAGQIRSIGATDTLTMVAARNGGEVTIESASDLPDQERYFAIELWQYSSAPLAYDATGAMLAAHVRVSWPYKIPDSNGAFLTVPEADRSSATFTVAINR